MEFYKVCHKDHIFMSTDEILYAYSARDIQRKRIFHLYRSGGGGSLNGYLAMVVLIFNILTDE